MPARSMFGEAGGMDRGDQAHLHAMLADIEALVGCESPSEDHAAVARSADVVAAMGERLLGVGPERIVVDGCTHLRWRLGDTRRVLLLGHHDTVWPIGSLLTHPHTVEDGVLRGPGCFDMKTGLVMAFHAVAGLAEPTGVTLLVTGDEEIGSPSSRALIEDEARACATALVLEAAGPGGALKTERKGVSRYDVHVTGRAAHSGLDPEKGVNATVEAAHQVLAVAGLDDPQRGTARPGAHPARVPRPHRRGRGAGDRGRTVPDLRVHRTSRPPG
jgi:glutamate carboxypeptidase